MAVAGNTLDSIECCWRNGILTERGHMHRAKEVVEKDLSRAIERLRAGETVYLHLFGANLWHLHEEFSGKLSND